MPRDLADVADYFLPQAAPAQGAPAGNTRAGSGLPQAERLGRPAALPIVAVPVGERDVVRAAFVWNLAVEVARLGGSATLLAPSPPRAVTASGPRRAPGRSVRRWC